MPTEPAAITEDNASQVAAGAPMTSSLISFQDTMSFQTLTEEVGTYDGPEGGSITAGFDIDAAPVGVVSTGDRFSVTFNDCMLDVDFRINGGIVIDFESIIGDWQVDDMWSVDFGFAINSLTFSSGPVQGSFDGNWSQSASYDTGDKAFDLAGDFMTAVNDGTGWRAASFDGLTLGWSYDATAMEASYSVDGQFASTDLGGSVLLSTIAPFVTRDADEYPYAGTLVCEGAGGSTLTLTVLDETEVQLDVDADGDGTAEYTDTLTWFELDV